MINPGRLVVWVDGALVGEEEARISPFDHGLLTGDGVFETLRVYRGEPYCWRRHYERLARSASGMGLAIPPGAALRRAALDLIEANGLTDGRLRITVTGGPSPLGSERGRATPTLILAASELPPPGPSTPVGGGHRAVAPQRAGGAGGAEDDLLRRERAGPGGGQGGRRRGGDLLQHPGRAVRGDRHQRVRRDAVACCARRRRIPAASSA